MDVQVFRLSTLMKSYDLASEMLEREHVTLHIRRHPKMFKHLHLIAAHDVYWPELGLTLDEQSDYLLLKRIIEHFGEDNRLFSCKEVIDLLRANPDWLKINEHVRRKGDT
jgi:spore coat polysaccharide biosynthesis protein SpsF